METRVERTRRLRRDQTPAEALLWNALRGRRLCGLKFRRQHPIGPYVADFYCAQHRLVVEIDGRQHQRDPQWHHDRGRATYLRDLGIRILRFQNHTVLTDIDRVREAVRQACASP